MTTLSELPKANQEHRTDAADARSLSDEITSTRTIVQSGTVHNASNVDGRLLGSHPTIGEARRPLPTRGAS
jgi:hypothetical protein